MRYPTLEVILLEDRLERLCRVRAGAGRDRERSERQAEQNQSAPSSARDSSDAFMVGREFAHLHPPSDGSLHLVLAPAIVDAVIDNGWAERHPLAGRYGLLANIVMVYGPRDEEEVQIVADLVRASHAFAAG
jgi:hypothetical protein